MSKEALTEQAVRDERSRYVLAQLKALNTRAHLFIEIGSEKGYYRESPFAAFEAETVKLLGFLGEWINDEQLVNAVWEEQPGRLVEGGWTGFTYDIEPNHYALDVHVVPYHEPVTEPRTIGLQQIIDLQAANATSQTVQFTFGRKGAGAKPGERTQSIIGHYTQPIVTPFREAR